MLEPQEPRLLSSGEPQAAVGTRGKNDSHLTAPCDKTTKKQTNKRCGEFEIQVEKGRSRCFLWLVRKKVNISEEGSTAGTLHATVSPLAQESMHRERDIVRQKQRMHDTPCEFGRVIAWKDLCRCKTPMSARRRQQMHRNLGLTHIYTYCVA